MVVITKAFHQQKMLENSGGMFRDISVYAAKNHISLTPLVCYLHWLEESARACSCAIHAYALMTNPVHLLLTPAENDAPSRLMQSLGRRYVQYANRFYRRTGSLWEGRYKSSVVQAESYSDFKDDLNG